LHPHKKKSERNFGGNCSYNDVAEHSNQRACPLASIPTRTCRELSTVATLVFDDNHVTSEVASPLVLLPKTAVAVNCWVCRAPMEIELWL